MMINLKEYNFSGYVLYKDGKIYSLKSNRFLSGWINRGGYRTFALTDDSGKVHQNVKCHILMAKCFIPNDASESKIQVNHINGIKTDNRLENLEWVTCSENTQHAFDTGLRPPPYLTDESKLPEENQIIHDWKIRKSYVDVSEDDVHKICSYLQDGYRVCDVSRITGIDRRFIQFLRDDHKQLWSHVVSLYDFSKIKRKNKTSIIVVVKICELLQDGLGVLEISRNLNVDRKLVGNIRNRINYKSISDSFKF